MIKIFCDLDSVLCSFSEGCRKIFSHYPEEHLPLNDIIAHLEVSTKEFWDTIDSYKEDFWCGLEPEEWAEELVEIIKFYDPNFIVLTSPSRSHFAASGKVLWLQKFFKSKKFSNYIITPAKNKQLLANKKSVLIDDNDKNCEQFRSRLGYTVLFPRIWNKNHELENEKIEHTKKQLQLIKQYI